MAQTTILVLSSVTIVSCYKNPAELVLFHDVEMNGIFGKEHSLGVVQGLPESECSGRKRAALPSVEEQRHFFYVVTTLSKRNRANWELVDPATTRCG